MVSPVNTSSAASVASTTNNATQTGQTNGQGTLTDAVKNFAFKAAVAGGATLAEQGVSRLFSQQNADIIRQSGVVRNTVTLAAQAMQNSMNASSNTSTTPSTSASSNTNKTPSTSNVVVDIALQLASATTQIVVNECSINTGGPFHTTDGRPLPDPNHALIQRGHTPKLDHIDTPKGRVYFYKFYGQWGHSCAIQVVEVPPGLEELQGWTSHNHEGKHAWRAARGCKDELAQAMNNIPPSSPDTSSSSSTSGSSSTSSSLDSSSCSSTSSSSSSSSTSSSLDSSSCSSTSSSSSSSSTSNTSDPSSSSGSSSSSSSSDPSSSQSTSDPQNAPNAPKNPPNVEEKEEEQDTQATTLSFTDISRIAVASRIQGARADLRAAQRIGQGATQLQTHIDQNPTSGVTMQVGDTTVTLTPEQTRQLANAAKVETLRKVGDAALKRTIARVDDVAGPAIRAAAQIVQQEAQMAQVALGSGLGSATVDFTANVIQGRYDTLGDAAMAGAEMSAQVAVNTGAQSLQNMAFEGGKQLLDLDGLPALGTVMSVYKVGNTVLKAQSFEEGARNVADVSANMAINYACMTTLQAAIPVPFLGAALGGVLGNLIVRAKDAVLEEIRR